MNLLFLEEEVLSTGTDIDFASLPLLLKIAFIVVGTLLVLASIVAAGISVFLFFKYVTYNHKKNSAKMTGKEIARKILDDNGLQKIKVKASGSFLFGNSYSHFFKKVRLRRLTWKKDSVTSLAMASQKSALAIMDKENDPDMKKRIALTPLIYFGPLACVPLILIGLLIDIIVFNFSGVCTVVASVLGLGIYAVSFIYAVKILKTEMKAQEKALTIVKESNLANDEEIEDMKALFKLYNIEYINDMIIALLELIWRILQIVAQVSSKSSSSNN